MNLKDDAIPPRFENGRDRLAYLLAEYKIGVYLALGAVTLLFVSGRWEVPELPQPAREFLLAFAMGIVPAMIVSKVAIVNKFIPDPRENILVWIPDEDGNTLSVELWKVPTDTWEAREHTDGRPVIQPDGVFSAIVTNFEWDKALGQIRVRGCSPDLADPADLQATKGKLDAVFNDLLESREELTNMRATLNLKQHKMEEEVINALVAAVEFGVAFEPQSKIVESDEFEQYQDDSRTDAIDDPVTRDLEATSSTTATAATDGGEKK